MGIAHLDVVAEDVVVADLERRDPRRLALALLDAGQVVLAVQGDAAQVVQLGVHPVGDHAALLYLVVLRVGIDLAGDAVAHLRHRVDAFGQGVQLPAVGGFDRRLERLDRRERVLQLHQLAGCHALGGDARGDALQVADHRDLLADGVGQVGLPREAFDDVEPLVDPRRVLDRHGDPPLEQPSAHGGQRAVDHVGETALLAGAVRGEELQVADRELVDPHVVVLVDPRDRGDVSRLAVLGELEVVEDRSGGRDAACKVVHAEALERGGAELPAELLAVHLLGEDPLVEPVGVEPRSEGSRETVLIAALVDHLLRCEVRDQLVHVGVVALGNVEFAGRDVEKGHTRCPPAEVDRGDVVVLLVGQDVVAQHDARRDQFDHPALDQPLDQLRVLELFADGHTFAGPHQFREVGIDGVVGKPGQLDVGRRAVGPACERDAQDAAGLDRIVAERLVEVPHAEEQDGVGMHRLDRVVLLHQGGLDVFLVYLFLWFVFGCHSSLYRILYCKQRYGFFGSRAKPEADFFGGRRPVRPIR